MYLVYADEQGNVYDHSELFGLARSGDMIVEILDDELIPLPEGATLVGRRAPERSGWIRRPVK